MILYEYAPVFEKRKEKLLVGLSLFLAAALYLGSQIPSAPLPWLLQVLAMVPLVALVMLTSLCLLRRYVYRIEQREDGELDFIIDEYSGKRKTTVCRVAVSSVLSVDPWDASARKKLSEAEKGRQFFNYTGVLFDEKQFLIEIREGGTLFFVRMCADERLIALLGEL